MHFSPLTLLPLFLAVGLTAPVDTTKVMDPVTSDFFFPSGTNAKVAEPAPAAVKERDEDVSLEKRLNVVLSDITTTIYDSYNCQGGSIQIPTTPYNQPITSAMFGKTIMSYKMSKQTTNVFVSNGTTATSCGNKLQQEFSSGPTCTNINSQCFIIGALGV